MIFAAIIIVVIIVFVGIYLRSPSVKGKIGEKSVVRKLEVGSIFRENTKILSNVYIPKDDGGTSEIDIIYITKKGLFVIENKNYAGYIFGDEKNENWTQTLYSKRTNSVEKHHFYNPIFQNKTHIKNLKNYLGSDIKTFSLVTFGNRGELKSINCSLPDVYICNLSRLNTVLNEIYAKNEDVLTDKEIEDIYIKLYIRSSDDSSIKKKHIENVKSSLSNTSICPFCGGKLVLKTAKRGTNVGSEFYGCSNYPKCKYTKNK